MKIEKLNTDKIRITLNFEDLKNNDIDIHTFMSNSTQNQNLFFYILDLAEEQYGFSTDNYKVRIETMYLNNNSFILNITRFKENINSKPPRVKALQKDFYFDLDSCFFIFSSANDFLDFYSILKNTLDITILHDCKYSLYLFKDNYFLTINSYCLNSTYKKTILNLLSEYCISIINKKNSFNLELKEFGKCLKNNCTF